MKTFNIAVRYLQNFNFKGYTLRDLDNCEGDSEKQKVKDGFKAILATYLKDGQHYVGNEHYWKIVFAVAAIHLIELEKGTPYTCFDICCLIIQEHEPPDSLFNGNCYKKTKYPKKMVDEWNDWCDKHVSPPSYLADKEIRFDIFMVCYAYIIEENETELNRNFLPE